MIAYLLLGLITYSTAYPFNSTECTECIEVFNYIHSHNDSLGEMIDDFNHVCRELNISGCENITRFADKVLMTNSTEICEFLDICDNLDLDNFVFDTGQHDIKIFRYYDLLIGYKLIMTDTNVLNFTKVWSIKLEEPYTDINKLVINPPYDHNSLEIVTGCDVCNAYDYILKITTENYVYYSNITSGLVFDRLKIENNYKPISGGLINLEPSYNSQQIIDSIYNGTLFTPIIDVNSHVSQCNYTGPSSSPPSPPTLYNCIRHTIGAISLGEWKLNIPSEPPRCGTALEMYCPHTRLGKLDCLNCIVRNQDLLSTCNSIDEQRWCDRSNFKRAEI